MVAKRIFPVDKSVYVRHLPYANKHVLTSLFANAGFHVRAIEYNNTFSLIMLDNEQEQEAAITELNGTIIGEYPIRVATYINIMASSRRKQAVRPLSTKIVIGPLSSSITEADLVEAFSDYSVSQCFLVPENKTAIVDFRDPFDPQNVITNFNNTQIGSNLVTISLHDEYKQQNQFRSKSAGKGRRRKYVRNYFGPALTGSRPPGLFFKFAKPLPDFNMEGYVPYLIEQLLKEKISNELGADPSILLRCNSVESYKKIFHALLFAEEIRMQVDIRQYDLHDQDIAKDRVGGSLHKVQVPRLAEKRPSVLRGDMVKVQKVGNRACNHQGFVHFVNLEDVLVSFHKSFDSSARYDIEFTFTRTPLRSQHRALDHIHTQVLEKLNGCTIIPDKPLPLTIASSQLGRVRLNEEQAHAVLIGLNNRSRPLIIHGPPGTGKTATVVELILQLARSPSNVILVCAPSNNAADLLAHLLSFVLSPKQLLRLNALQRNPRSLEPPSLKDYCYSEEIAKSSFSIPPRHILESYKVVVCTCIASGYIYSFGVERGHYTHIIIDEAGEALETESLVPFQLAGENTGLVLAGDHKQLGPIVRSPTALEWKLDRSLMERIIEKGCENVNATKLVQSYRAHPKILELYSSLFYNNELVPSADSRFVTSLCDWKRLPNKNIPVMVIHTEGREDREKDSPSWFNRTEIDEVLSTVRALSSEMGVLPEEIGIITPYRKQADKLQRAFYYPDNRNKGMKIGTVENFQGMERKVIILSLVRSQAEYLQEDRKFKLGFCSNPKRLNVAISRAQALLVIIGNAALFGSHDPHWHNLLEHCKRNNLFYGNKVPVWSKPATTIPTDNNKNIYTSNINDIYDSNNNNNNNAMNVDQAWREDY